MKKSTELLGLFFIELVNRSKLKTPKFFQYLKYFGLFASFCGFVPIILFELDVTGKWASTTVTVCLGVVGLNTWLVSNFAATDSSKKDNPESTPFTNLISQSKKQ